MMFCKKPHNFQVLSHMEKFENHRSIMKGKIIEHKSKQDVWKKPFVTNSSATWEVITACVDKCVVVITCVEEGG